MQDTPETGQQGPDDHDHRRPRSHGPARSAGYRPWAIGGICAVLVCGGAVGAYALTASPGGSGADGKSSDRSAPPPAVTTPTKAQADQAVSAFLQDWQAGRLSSAAGRTDDRSGALSDLTNYQNGLHPSSLTLGSTAVGGADPKVAHALRSTFKVSATVAGHAWSYPGAADVTDVGGKPVVHWATDVLHPGLASGERLKTGSTPATTANAVDRNGRQLTAAEYPSLASVLGALNSTYAEKVQKAPGTGIAVTDASGKTLRSLQAFTSAQPGTVHTTLDAGVQAAAEKGIKDPHNKKMPSSAVAVDYRTGEIRAIAGNAAIGGAAAPGSTMKMITSAALIDKAGAKPTDSVPCVAKTVINGQTFHNMDNEKATGNTLIQDFAMSCNTAFINESTKKLNYGDLKDEADNVFGLGSWSIGVPSVDPSVPTEDSKNMQAEQTIGQGQVTMNPLVLASVASTIADSGFHQPIVIPGLKQAPAPRPISANTASLIQQMMEATAQYGTAAPRMKGIDGGAKTGTAETASGTNGWFAAYDRGSGLAVGALTVGGKQGVLSAGYVAQDILTG
jgi:hypothetical protein